MGDTDLFQESLAAIKGRSWKGGCNVAAFVGSGTTLTETTLSGSCEIELSEYDGDYEIKAWWRQNGRLTYEKELMI